MNYQVNLVRDYSVLANDHAASEPYTTAERAAAFVLVVESWTKREAMCYEVTMLHCDYFDTRTARVS